MAIRNTKLPKAEAISGAALPAAFQERILSLEREADWDGQEADAITAATCAAAPQFVKQILAIRPDLPLPFSAPSVYGAVSLRWVNGDQDLAIYVFSPDRVSRSISSSPMGGMRCSQPNRPRRSTSSSPSIPSRADRGWQPPAQGGGFTPAMSCTEKSIPANTRGRPLTQRPSSTSTLARSTPKAALPP